LSPEPIKLALVAPVTDARIEEGAPPEAHARVLARLRAEAFEAGRVAGNQEALEGAASLLLAGVERLDEERERAAGEVASAAVALGTRIASRLLRVEVDAGRYAIEEMVREVLRASGAATGSCTVHLNPSDATRIDATRFRDSVRFLADPEVRRGDVRLETERGLLVREMDAALAAITERLGEEIQ
jgi:flagellar biosynthesis/type III secretory pathway protein FliH